VTKVLSSPETSVSTVNDYYQAYVLNLNAQEYEVPQQKVFTTKLNKVLGDVWIREFDASTFKWQLDKKGTGGITPNKMRLLELMSSV